MHNKMNKGHSRAREASHEDLVIDSDVIMEISWRVPKYKEAYFMQPICSNACLHSSTNLSFQLILAPTKSHMAFYLLCTNAMELLQGKQVSVSWRLSLKHQNGEKIIKGESLLSAKSGSHSTFESAVCREFVTQDYFKEHVDEFLINGVLEARAEFSLAVTSTTPAEPEPPVVESETVTFFAKDSTVAVNAGRSGFWLAQALEDIDFEAGSPSRTIHVRWYEKNRQSGQYYLTESRDRIDLLSIHPIKLEFETRGGSLTIKETPAYEVLKTASSKKAQH